MTQPAAEYEVPDWSLGWRLKRALAWGEVSVQGMAEELGVSRQTISRWCHDLGRPKRIYLRAWAARCRVPYDWLIFGDEGLPRVDSNHQPAGWSISDHSERPSRVEILALRKTIPIRLPSAAGR